MSVSRDESPVHAGAYLKQSVIPEGLSVTKCAEMLDVSRPALSNLLNGRAGLSPEMAARFEKAFRVNRTELLEMQARFDEFSARSGESKLTIQAYAPPFLQVTAREIADWADRLEARSLLPALLRMLVHTTGLELKKVDFPGFDNSQRRGWDGQVDSGAQTPWVPSGESGWEFGCNADPKSKAEDDYSRRTRNVTANERTNTTFVFVSPRNWSGKNDWANAKKAENEWKDVRALDASDLEQWLEQSIPAQIRFREFQGSLAPGVASLEQTWQEWADVTEPALSRELFTSAVDRHRDALEQWFAASPSSPFVVAADSPLEALAFLACAIGPVHQTVSRAYDRVVVIRTVEGLRSVTKGSQDFIAVIASPEVEQALAGLQRKTHTLIVRGRNMPAVNTDIELGLLGCEGFRKALTEMGLGNARIDQLARESARCPAILRRRLADVPAVKSPPWAGDHATARALIPLIFVGAWNSGNKDDQEILSCLTGSSYEDVEVMIAQLRQEAEPPVWSIGGLRGIVSKIDALDATHGSITTDDLKRFLFAAEVVLSERDPALDLPEGKRWAANLYGKDRNYSSELRQGICDTLVLMAVHGKTLIGDRLETDLEAAVARAVSGLLLPPARETWLSQRRELPQYAEAAPETFLTIVEQDLNSSQPEIAALFSPADSGIFGECHRTDLLWALELLAWKPEQLMRVTFILARLCEWKVDDNWEHSSLGSLQSIFRVWIPQTSATLNERNQALGALTTKFPDIGWQVCVDQFNTGPASAHPNYRPRWRSDSLEAGEPVMPEERRRARKHAIELALNWDSHDARMLGDLVERLGSLGPEQRNRVWDAISDWAETGPLDDQKVLLRERIRRSVLTRPSRLRPTDKASRDRARQAQALLDSSDPVLRHRWLFLRQWVEESSDEIQDDEVDYHGREKRIAQLRRDALLDVWQQKGLDGILDLCRSGEASGTVGYHLAEIDSGIEPAEAVRQLLSVDADGPRAAFDHCVAGFLGKLDDEQRRQTLCQLLESLANDHASCVRLLQCAPFDGTTWIHVDDLPNALRRRYWETVVPNWSRHRTGDLARLVDELLEVDRPRAAFFAAHMEWKNLDSARLVRVLTDAATKTSEPAGHYRLDRYYISKALDVLEERGDTSREMLARLEFLYISVLDHTEHGIRNVEAQLSIDPALFMHALASAFKRKDGGTDPAEWRIPDDDSRSDLASAAYSLLTSASRIPGTQPDGTIKRKNLKKWVHEARVLASRYGRAEIGDEMIGRLLSHCPEGTDGIWPCEPVREVIEEVASVEIGTGMAVGLGNARGMVMRGEGGEQERELANLYGDAARKVAFEYPYTSGLLREVARGYEREAEWWDNEASARQRLQN